MAAGIVRVAAYTGGRQVPSARFRVRQYIPLLRAFGIKIREHPAAFGSYPPRRRALRPLWGAASLVERIPGVLGSLGSDLTLLQREMLSTFVTLESCTHR